MDGDVGMLFDLRLLNARHRTERAALSSRCVAIKLSVVYGTAAHMTSLDYYATEDLLTDDERAARDRARRFVQEEVMSEIVPCHPAAKFPEHLTARMRALGFNAPRKSSV